MALCAEHGYGRLTIEAIAARAGVSKKTIYRWWPSKGSVVLEAIYEMGRQTANFPDTGDLQADLHTQLSAVIRLLTPPYRSALTGVIAEALNDPDLAAELRESLIRPYIAQFEDRLRRAQEQGQLHPDADLTVALDLVYGPIYHRLAFHLGLPEPSYLDTLIEHALRALAPGGRQAPT